jgi:flagellar hook-length control protein FliK
MTISVTPDNLGPVIVRAQVSSAGIRVELFAPNDAGREALRTILPDLRRDLAGGGLNSNLSLSSDGRPAGNGAGYGTTTGNGTPGDARGWTRDDRADDRAGESDRTRSAATESVPAIANTAHGALPKSPSAIDVMV